MQQIRVPIFSYTDCRSKYGSTLPPGMICAGYEMGGKDACQVGKIREGFCNYWRSKLLCKTINYKDLENNEKIK